MFEDNHTRICRKLVFREIRFHKIRSALTILVAVLAAALFSFVLFLASSEQAGYEYQVRTRSDTLSDLHFTGLTRQQAKALSSQRIVKDVSWYQPVGTLSEGDDTYFLAPYSAAYAATVEAVPTRGRLPERENEIAMEVQAAYALGGSSRVGDLITLRFTPEQGGSPVEQEFLLVGTWDSSMYSYLMWVSDRLAARFPAPETAADVTAGVDLWRTRNIRQTAEQLAAAIPAGAQQYTVNSVFQESQARHIAGYVDPVRKTLPFVFLCGFLMFFSLFQMTLELDIRFYARLKALGMTPSQLRRVAYQWVGLLTACSVPAGWLLGGCLTHLVSHTFVLSGSPDPGFTAVYPWYDFALSLLAAWLTVFLAGIYPAWKVSRMQPAQALRFSAPPRPSRPAAGASSQPPALPLRPYFLLGLARKELSRRRGRMAFALTALVLCAMFATAVTVQYTGLDPEKYVAQKFSFDYLLKGDGQKYNVFYDPNDSSLTPELYDRLCGAVGAQNISRIYFAETRIRLDDTLWRQIVDYYDRNLAYYQDYLQYTGFEEAYRRLKQEHTVSVAVYGVEQEYMRAMTGRPFALSGVYDPRQFETGLQAYLAGMNKNTTNHEDDYDQPLPPTGSALTLDGVTYHVMGTARRPYNSIFVRPAAAFYLECYLSRDTFLRRYPGRSPVEIVLSAPDGLIEEAEQIAEEYQTENGYNYFTVSRRQYENGARAAAWTQTGPLLILSVVLLLLAFLGIFNLLLHRTLARSREFAVYRSLGMSRRELWKLLTAENLLFTLLSGICVLTASALTAGPLMRLFYKTPMDWWFTYHFTLLPAYLITGLLLLTAAALPFLCLHLTERESITHRLNQDEAF